MHRSFCADRKKEKDGLSVYPQHNQTICIPESLSELERLVDDSLPLFIVAQLSVSLYGQIVNNGVAEV